MFLDMAKVSEFQSGELIGDMWMEQCVGLAPPPSFAKGFCLFVDLIRFFSI